MLKVIREALWLARAAKRASAMLTHLSEAEPW